MQSETENSQDTPAQTEASSQGQSPELAPEMAQEAVAAEAAEQEQEDAPADEHAHADEVDAGDEVDAVDEVETPPEADPLGDAPEELLPALKRRGFEKLTAVQQAIANADDGRRDLRISSQTGSGKTVAIGFSMVDGVVVDKRDRVGPTTLVIAPTRELAMQVKEELSWLFADLDDVTCEVVTGGTNIERERMRLRRKPSVLVATPGRLLDHLQRGGVDISSVTQLVLDEADQMLDLGFKDELDGILECLPEQRRTHLVSATFPPAVLELANRFQHEPILVQGTAPGEAHNDIEHIACRIADREHYQAVVNMLLVAGDERTLVFVRTREETTRMAEKLANDGFDAAAINGDLAQAQRTRTLAAFRSGRIRTLIATDVAARGLDIPSVTMVIHVELPMDSATYVHRSGRTGRAGQKGKSVLLVPKSRSHRTTRMFRNLRLEPRWAWPPSAEVIKKKQLERAEEAALTMLTAAAPATPEKRAAAANLLRERDPVEVVATLLTKTMTKTRPPFEMKAPKGNYDENGPGPRREYPQRQDGDGPRPQRMSADQRGTPGSAPSWQRGDRGESRAPEPGFSRFRINWGPRDGANPRRIMAHICRRGEVESRMIGSISMDANQTTFEVSNQVADEFARRVQRRDRRDPHLIIHRETFHKSQGHHPQGHHPQGGGPRGGKPFGQFRGNGHRNDRNDGPRGGGYRGAMRTRQSR